MLKKRILHAEYYPPFAGHPDERHMYDTMLKKVFWPHMMNDGYQTVNNCTKCERSRGKTRRKRNFQLLPASGPLKIFPTDILGPPPQTKPKYVFIILITDQNSKATRAVPSSKTTETNVANAFFDHWMSSGS